MKIKFQPKDHPKPIVLTTTKVTPEDLEAITPKTIDAEQVERKFSLSQEPVSETGNLFFKMNNALSLRTFWAHLKTRGFVDLLDFPNGGKIKDMEKDDGKVTVYRGEDKIVFEVDAIMYTFLRHSRGQRHLPLIADPHVTSLEDLRQLAAELTIDALDQVLSSGQKLDYEA